MVTSKDVAKAANVSISTVSRVFSNPGYVNEKTIERVRKVARELHYFPNLVARSLKTNKSGFFGMILSDINNNFYFYILEKLFQDIKNRSNRLFVVFSEEDREMEMDSVMQLVSSNVETLVFTPVSRYDERIESVILKNRITSLQLYRKAYDSLDSLVIDDAYGSYLATLELIRAGHENIVLFDYDVEIPTGRADGYIRAFQETGLHYRHENIVHIPVKGDYNHLIQSVLDTIRPTAVIPVSSVFATSVFNYIKANKLRIKEDISLVVYDDTSVARYLDVTVIGHPLEEIAETASRMIAKRAKIFDLDPQHYQIKPFLIRRDSIKCLRD